MKLMQATGKITGKLVNATKTAPSKTKNGLVSAKNQFLTGFNTGANRPS